MERRDFYVDYSPAQKRWVLHWKKPKDTETPELVFAYGTPDASLLSFETEYGIKDTINELVVHAYDPTEAGVDLDRPDRGPGGAGPAFREGGGRIDRNKPRTVQDPGVPKKEAPRRRCRSSTRRGPQQRRQARAEVGHGVPPGRRRRGDRHRGGAAVQDSRGGAVRARWFLARRDHFMVAKGTSSAWRRCAPARSTASRAWDHA
jgi:hypothetical protein